MSLVQSISILKYFNAAFNLSTYCIIDPFGSCLVSMNLLFSVTTIFGSYTFLNYSNDLFIS